MQKFQGKTSPRLAYQVLYSHCVVTRRAVGQIPKYRTDLAFDASVWSLSVSVWPENEEGNRPKANKVGRRSCRMYHENRRGSCLFSGSRAESVNDTSCFSAGAVPIVMQTSFAGGLMTPSDDNRDRDGSTGTPPPGTLLPPTGYNQHGSTSIFEGFHFQRKFFC
jgi:hypothetical protein